MACHTCFDLRRSSSGFSITSAGFGNRAVFTWYFLSVLCVHNGLCCVFGRRLLRFCDVFLVLCECCVEHSVMLRHLVSFSGKPYFCWLKVDIYSIDNVPFKLRGYAAAQ
jgi:hypothetical protein